MFSEFRLNASLQNHSWYKRDSLISVPNHVQDSDRNISVLKSFKSAKPDHKPQVFSGTQLFSYEGATIAKVDRRDVNITGSYLRRDTASHGDAQKV